MTEPSLAEKLLQDQSEEPENVMATPHDLEVRLGMTFDEAQIVRAAEIIELASDLILTKAPKDTEPVDVPDGVRIICVEIAARVWINPASVQSEGHGSQSVSFGSSAGLTLSKEEVSELRTLFGHGGAYTLPLR